MPSFYAIYACLAFQHDLWTLGAAIFLCAVGSTVTFALWRQISESTEPGRRRLLFALAVLCASCSVWATHFIAMLGYVEGLDLPISVFWTVASLLLAVALYALAAAALIRAKRSRTDAGAAALALTAALAGMHYTGIQAFRESALLVWQPSYVLLSILGALLVSHAAIRAFVQSPGLTGLFGAAGLFSLSVVWLHFAGMAGLTLMPFVSAEATAGSIGWLAPGIGFAVVTIALGGAAAIAFDRFAMRRQLAEADRLRRLAEELRAANEDARRANAELTRARDLAEEATRGKSRFLAMMSHEIRTPINGVLGMAEALSAMRLPDEQRECVSVIQSSGRALLAIINDILDISKLEQTPQSFARSRFDLRELLEDVAALAAPLAEARGLRLHQRLPAEVSSHLVGDENRIRQIATNLVGNAIKFTEAGHVLIDVAATADGEGVEIRVSDTGIGIQGAQIDSIFEAFFQSQSTISDRLGGTGLGLTIGRTLARQMGGDIRAESRPGAGSVFTLTLPVDRWHPEAPAGPLPATGGRFAVLAENPLDRQIVCDLIRGCGAEPVPCPAAGEIDPERVAGVVVCEDGPAPALVLAPLPVLRIVPPAAFAGPAPGAGETRILRPVRRARLAAWLAETLSGPQAAPALPEAAPPAGGIAARILVVDDSATNRLVVRRLLRAEGMEFVEAANGREACDLSAGRHFSHILMDVSMPKMDGLEATATIRAREERAGGARIPIVGLTAHAFEEDRIACLRAGMDDVVTKPASRETLLAALRGTAPEADRPAA